MFDQTSSMFEGYRSRLKKIKKKTYEERFAAFLSEYSTCFDDMTQYIKGREDTEVAAAEVANIFAENVFSEYGTGGKLSASDKTDLSLYMIYYIFPSILKTSDANAGLLCYNTFIHSGGCYAESVKIKILRSLAMSENPVAEKV